MGEWKKIMKVIKKKKKRISEFIVSKIKENLQQGF